jgi:hypothetical protein
MGKRRTQPPQRDSRPMGQQEGFQFLMTLRYPVWFAAIREAGHDEITIFTDDFGRGEGVLLLQSRTEVESFAAQLAVAQHEHPHEVVPVEMNSLQELYDWMSGPVKAAGVRMIYHWEHVSARGA